MIRLIIIMLLIAGAGFLALSQSLEPQTAVIAGNLAVGDAVLEDGARLDRRGLRAALAERVRKGWAEYRR